MILNILTITFESLLFFVSGFLILSILLLIFRVSFSGKLYQILFGLVIINAIHHFLSSTNPEQNSIVILLILSVFYLFLFFIIKVLKKDSTNVFKISFPIIFIIFSLLIMFIGKGEYLESKNTNVSSEISIGNTGEIFYKGLSGLKSNVGFSNNYGNDTYDTIRYDINLDGFVDIKTIDSNNDGIIDDTIVYTYDIQKILLLILLIGSILCVYIFSNGGNKIKFKKHIGNNTKKIDLSAFISGKKNNKVSIKKIISLSLILSIIFSQVTLVSAKTYEEMTAYERQQTSEYKNGLKIAKYFKNIQTCKYSGCTEASLVVNNFLKNYYNNEKYKDIGKYIFSQFDDTLNTNIKYCGSGGFKTYYCGQGNEKIKEFDEIISKIFIRTLDSKEKQIIVNEEENLQVEEIVENIDKDENIEVNDIEIQEIEVDYKTETIINDGELSPKDLETAINDTVKDVKAFTDISGSALEGINSILGKKVIKNPDVAKNISGNLTKNIKKILGDDGMKAIDKLDDLGNKTQKLHKNSPKSYEKIKNNIGKTSGGFGKAIDAIGKIGTVFDIYSDYKDFEKKSGGNSIKTFLGTTTTTVLKHIVGSNPIDVGMSIVSGGLHLLGYAEVAENIEEFSLGDRSKQMVQDAILHEADETMGALDQTLRDLKDTYNDPNAGIIKKTTTFISSSLSFSYGVGIFGVNQVFDFLID